MTFNDNVQLDTSQVQSGGSGGGGFGGGGSFPGGINVGGGLIGFVIMILMAIFGGGSLLGGGGQGDTSGLPNQLDASQVSGAGNAANSDFSKCKTGADANRDDQCLVVATVNSVQNYYAQTLPKYQVNYKQTPTVLYSGSTRSACGTASNQVGPFYCPVDKKVYIDADFFQLLQRQFGADTGALAKEYVIAHEYGHAIQDQLGLLNRAQQDPQGEQSGGVRTELMADCLAGTWVKHATETKDANGTPFLKPVTEQDLESARSAAHAVGDDHIQSTMGSGRVNPESWTHGSSAARKAWFMKGYETGDINACDTYSPASVE